jgi:hypothetical protein
MCALRHIHFTIFDRGIPVTGFCAGEFG